MNVEEEIYKKFEITDEDKYIFDRIVKVPVRRRDEILSDIYFLVKHSSLTRALMALYRQQVDIGFVLADPLKPVGNIEKKIHDTRTGITFRLQWNPSRELRNVHSLLIERGIIAENVDESMLINKDKNGRACYLCKTNIDLQNPAEILLEINLAGEKYYAGANFAYITNNHFTIMNADHRPQQYRKKILDALNDFIDMTDGHFRSIFNGLAGASIEEHEHIQVTTEEFPIEEIRIEKNDILYETKDIKVSKPKYYIPTWIIEGTNRENIINIADKIIDAWHKLDEKHHSENIICSKIGKLYRTFIIVRDKRKLAGKGKKGAMATFDTGGNIVLSYESNNELNNENNYIEIDEKETFDTANFGTIKRMLEDISPLKQLEKIKFGN